MWMFGLLDTLSTLSLGLPFNVTDTNELVPLVGGLGYFFSSISLF